MKIHKWLNRSWKHLDTLMTPSKCTCWIPNLQHLRMWLLTDRGFKEVITLKRNWVGSNPTRPLSLEEESWTHRKIQRMCQHRRYVREQKKVARPQEREASEETRPADTLILDLHPKDREKIKFCCLSHPVCSILLWEPWDLNIGLAVITRTLCLLYYGMEHVLSVNKSRIITAFKRLIQSVKRLKWSV